MRDIAMIAIGILGYGSRNPSPEIMARLAEHPSVASLIIVWNEPTPAVSDALRQLQKNIPKLYVTENPENIGSAAGYNALLRQFSDLDHADYLFLLDDDLLPDPDCIARLVQTASRFSDRLDSTLLLAYRPKLPEINDLVEKKLGICRPRPGSCVAFHLLNVVKQNRETVRHSEPDDLFSIESAPWGGLFIPRRALSRLGAAREDFFLYAEDTELTYRFTRNSGKILLVSKAKIEDTDEAWNTVGGSISNLRRRVLILPEIKVFHEVRNRNYMARHYWPGFLPVYWLNKFLFLASAYFIGIFNGAFSRALLVHQAVNAGERMAAKESRRK